MKYFYGPVPSRRLGMSLGVSPIPKKTCNYSCIYCQLGRTNHMINTRQIFYPVEEIIEELKHSLFTKANFDVVTLQSSNRWHFFYHPAQGIISRLFLCFFVMSLHH